MNIGHLVLILLNILRKKFNDPYGLKYFVRNSIPLPETFGLDEKKNKLLESKIKIRIKNK